MFFRRRPAPVDPASARWSDLAARLELQDAGDVAERIRRWLALGDAELAPVYLLQRPGLPAVYLYDAHTVRTGPSGTVRATKRCCLVRSDGPISGVAFRAMPRSTKAAEAIEAGRSGGARVPFEADEAFERAVSVVARDVEAVAATLAAPVRLVLRRALVDRGAVEPRIVVGERHLVASFDAAPAEDELTVLEQVLADTLSLVALLPGPPAPAPTADDATAAVVVAAPHGRPAADAAVPPRPVPISPDDLLDLG